MHWSGKGIPCRSSHIVWTGRTWGGRGVSENRWRNFLKHLRDLKTHISSSSSRIHASKPPFGLFNLLPTLFPMQYRYSCNSTHLGLTLLCRPPPPLQQTDFIFRKNKFRLNFSNTLNDVERNFLIHKYGKKKQMAKGHNIWHLQKYW